jgi:hypothetical protein
MKSGPIVGIIFDREKAPGAHKLSDLGPDTAGRYLCDEHLPLEEAFKRDWDQDAHFIVYRLEDEDGEPLYARVTKRSGFTAELLRKGGKVAVTMMVFDHDLPKQGDAKQEWTEEGLGEFTSLLAQADLPPPSCWYTTLHGSRFVYVLETPVDHLTAESMARSIRDKYKAAGIELDKSCDDWTRLFRLPRTVREDTGRRYSNDDRFVFLNGGPALDPETIEANDKTEGDVFAEVDAYSGELPSVEEVDALLVKVGGNKKSYDSDWVKVAKKYLDGRESYDICFRHAKLDSKKFNGRNNAIVKISGQIIGMTARQPEATPEGIYALLFSALEQMQVEDEEGNDWHQIAWDIICRMWANESAQIEAENREAEKAIQKGKQTREELIKQIKADRPEDVPDDEEEADAWFRQRMVASDGRLHHIMRTDGSYNIRPVGDSMLIPMIRELGMENVIETHEMRGKTWTVRSAQSILNDHATPISAIVCSATIKTAYIEGDPGHRLLNMPVHSLNKKVEPKYDEEVEKWLEIFFGDKYDLGIMWLAWALETNAPICALNLFGAPGTGKGMLAAGLAECFAGEKFNNGTALGKYNAGLLDTPVVNCDEGVPNIKSDEALPLDQAFRTMVSGGNVMIRSMYQNPFMARIYPRILFTSNDKDILRSIVGHRDLTDDDIRAVEIRLLSIEVGPKARDYLTAHGNYRFTSGWVQGKHKSQYKLAGHIRWLYENRTTDPYGSGRLLVEGEVETSLVRGMRLRSSSSQAVVKALIKMIEGNNGNKNALTIWKSRVFVTAAGVHDYIMGPMHGIHEEISLPRTGQVLRQFAITSPNGNKKLSFGTGRARWVEIDLGILLEEALRYGTVCGKVERLLSEQPNGKYKIAAAMAHSGQD